MRYFIQLKVKSRSSVVLFYLKSIQFNSNHLLRLYYFNDKSLNKFTNKLKLSPISSYYLKVTCNELEFIIEEDRKISKCQQKSVENNVTNLRTFCGEKQGISL